MLLGIHVAAGGAALLLGVVAFTAPKGRPVHRLSGGLFAAAMLVMGASASILGFLKSPSDGNVFAGLMTAYFVLTAWATVRPERAWTRGFLGVALTVAVALATLDVVAGVEALRQPGGVRNGVPFPMFFFLAALLLLAAFGDLRALRAGPLRGGRRLARHLWRNGFALFIAAGSFFSVRARVARVLPEPLTTAPMRLLPIALLFGAIVYWLWRVRRRAPAPAASWSPPAQGR